MTLEELYADVREGLIDTVIVAMVDMQGRLVGKRVTARFFVDDVAHHGLHACSYLLGCDVEMEPLPGYRLTVQYPEDAIKTMSDLKQIPLRGPNITKPTTLDTVVNMEAIQSPTEVDHYQLFRVVDVYVSPKTEDLGTITGQIENIVKETKLPEGV